MESKKEEKERRKGKAKRKRLAHRLRQIAHNDMLLHSSQHHFHLVCVSSASEVSDDLPPLMPVQRSKLVQHVLLHVGGCVGTLKVGERVAELADEEFGGEEVGFIEEEEDTGVGEPAVCVGGKERLVNGERRRRRRRTDRELAIESKRVAASTTRFVVVSSAKSWLNSEMATTKKRHWTFSKQWILVESGEGISFGRRREGLGDGSPLLPLAPLPSHVEASERDLARDLADGFRDSRSLDARA